MIRMLTLSAVVVVLSASGLFINTVFAQQTQCQSQQQPQISALDLQLLQRNTPAQLPATTGPTREQIEGAVQEALDEMLKADNTSAMIRDAIRNRGRIQNVQVSPSDKPCDGACPDGKCDLKKDSLVIKPRVTKKSFSVFLTKFKKVDNHYVNN